jgi:hypothetical protein
MREIELRKHAICSRCKNKIGHTGLPLFWTLTIDRHGLDHGALTRNAGLTMMLGGHVALAQALGPDEEMTQKMMDTREITLCETCAMPIMEILEVCGPEENIEARP